MNHLANRPCGIMKWKSKFCMEMEFCCDREFCAEKRLQKPDLYVKLLEAKMNKRRGGLTEWLRSLIGNQVRRQRPVGSSPMSSANNKRTA